MLTFCSLALLIGSAATVAEDAMDCRFTVCGVTHQFPDRRIDWSFNPTYNGYSEWPWQFARMNFLPDLAKHYRETGNERAAQAFVDIVGGFIDAVPPPPPRTSPYVTKSWRTIDTGLRASNWVASYFSFTNSPAMTAEFRFKVLRSLEDHLRRLEKPMTSNNWRIIELSGIVDITLAFSTVSRAAERRAVAERELADVLVRQLYPDGFHFELSPGYHGILDTLYSGLAMHYRHFGVAPPEFLEKGIELAFELYPHIARPDRFLPCINDSGRESIVQRMKTAARIFPDRKDYLWFATDGFSGARPDYLSYAFPYSGAVVFRDSWERDAVWGYVDMSPFGYGHQHEDKLNFLLFAYGKEMLCEGGNYAYDNSEMRQYVLSTRAHNTIRIDGKDQNARRSWEWKDEMLHQRSDLTFSTTPEKDVAVSDYALGYGEGDDYENAVTHRRTVEFVKNRGVPFFRITDRLAAKDRKVHSYEQIWHLETCELDISDGAFTADYGDGVRLEAKFRSENGRLVDMIGVKTPNLQGWMPVLPAGPHEHRPIHTPILKGSFKGETTLLAVFLPVRSGRSAEGP